MSFLIYRRENLAKVPGGDELLLEYGPVLDSEKISPLKTCLSLQTPHYSPTNGEKVEKASLVSDGEKRGAFRT